ncbi:MAG: FG-GAP-like repeat-containing protein [Pseudomonadota bacterium]
MRRPLRLASLSLLCAVLSPIFLTAVSFAASVPTGIDSDRPPVAEGAASAPSDTFPKDAPNKLPEVSKNVEGSSGSFSWSIPIEVPAYYGLEPHLALTYNSNAGNGMAGVGWSLSGYSTIERKGPAYSQPTYNYNGTGYDNLDGFYLDGQELIPCTSQAFLYTPGDPRSGFDTRAYSPSCQNASLAITGTTRWANPPNKLNGFYTTRSDSFQRIYRDSNQWTVWRKDGSVAVYSRICNSEFGTFRWGLSMVTNANGSYAAYEATCTEGLKSVRYGAERFSVDVSTTPRPSTDRPTFNDGAQTLTIDQRIQSIAVKANGTKVRSYGLAYDDTSASGRSLLTSVTQYGSDGISQLPPTKIEWYKATALLEPFAPVSGDEETWRGDRRQAVTGDFDGDGVSDLLLKGIGLTGETWFAKSGADPTNVSNSWGMKPARWFTGGGSQEYSAKILSGDFDGDGRTDLLVQPVRSLGRTYPCPEACADYNVLNCNMCSHSGLSTGDTKLPAWKPWLLMATENSDLPRLFSTAVDVSQYEWIPASWCQRQDSRNSFQCWDSSAAEMIPGDFNGDRQTDIFVRGVGAPFFLMAQASGGSGRFLRQEIGDVLGGGGTTPMGNLERDYTDILPTDFNGDGKTDLIFKPRYYPGAPTNLVLLVSRRTDPYGSGQSKYGLVTISSALDSWQHAIVIPADFNGDGLPDLFVQGNVVSIEPPSPLTPFMSLWINNGSAALAKLASGYTASVPFTQQGVSFTSFPSISSSALSPVDLNGDGKMDLVSQGRMEGDNNIYWLQATGNGFYPAQISSGLTSENWRLTTADFSGYGKTDLLFRQVQEGWLPVTGMMRGTRVVDGGSPDLVKKITLPTGGTYTVTYKPSSFWPENNSAFPITQTVQTLEVSDGVSPTTSKTEYSYSGGAYDRRWKKPLGFKTVTIKLPKAEADESENPYVRTTYNQTFETAGLPLSSKYYLGDPAGDGILLSETKFTYFRLTNADIPWQEDLVMPYWYVTLPKTTQTDTYDTGGALGFSTLKEEVYDLSLPTPDPNYATFGNLVFEKNYGNYKKASGTSSRIFRGIDPGGGETINDTLPNDNQVTRTTYQTFNYSDAAHPEYTNLSYYMVDRPVSVAVYSGTSASGTPLSESAMTYFDRTDLRFGNPKTRTLKVYDPLGEHPSTPDSYMKSFDYFTDYPGNLKQETNELGAAMAYDYDGTFHLYRSKTTNPLGQVTEVTSWNNVCGAPLSVKDPNGKLTKTEYDVFCRVTKKTMPTGEYEKTSYRSLDNSALTASNRFLQTAVPGPIGPDGNQKPEICTWNFIDGLGRTWKSRIFSAESQSGTTVCVADAGNLPSDYIYTKTTFNGRGQVQTKTAPAKRGDDVYRTRTLYDPLNRPLSLQYDFDNGGPTVFAEYTALGDLSNPYSTWKVTYTDEEGHKSADIYNSIGKLARHEEYLDGTAVWAKYEYDVRGNLKRITDFQNNPTETVFDSRGLIRREVDPDRGTTTFGYDALGQLLGVQTAKSQSIIYAYDALGRMRKKWVNRPNTETPDVQWDYDQPQGSSCASGGYCNIGHLTTMRELPGNSTTNAEQYNYDASGRLLQTVRRTNSAVHVYSQTYDPSGRVRNKVYPFGVAYTNSYNSLGQLTSVSLTTGSTTSPVLKSATYNAAGQPLELWNGNGTKTTYDYSPARGWLTSIRTVNATTGAELQNLNYSQRNKEGMLDGWGPWAFIYDSMHRLKKATYQGNGSSPNTETFTYDAIGNLKTKLAGASSLKEYCYPEPESARPHAVFAVTSSGGCAAAEANPQYLYDPNGNMTKHRNVTTGITADITWSVENFPTSFKPNGGTETKFVYDGNNQRLRLITPDRSTLYLDGGAEEISPAP